MMVRVCYYQVKDQLTGELVISKCMARLADFRSGKITGIPLFHTVIQIDDSKLDLDGLYCPGGHLDAAGQE